MGFSSFLFSLYMERGKKMNDQNNLSRANRSKSRKSNNQILLFFVLLAVVFVIILFLLITFGNKEKPKQVDDDENNTVEIVEDNKQPSDSEIIDTESDNEEVDSDDMDENTSNRLEEFKIDVPEMDQADDNIIEVYSGNWDPIGTTQTGDHATVYTDGSDDRVEIKMAVTAVTGIPENDMEVWFVGNGGDHQSTIATISDKALENYYKVYLSWIDHQGWQVSKVEKVHEYKK